MIEIDDSNLISQALSEEGVYHVEVMKPSQKISKVLLNGVDARHVIFADTNKGYIIRAKKNLGGQLLTSGDSIPYEIILGKVEVILNGLEKQTE